MSSPPTMDVTTFMLRNTAFLQAVSSLGVNSELRFCPQGREYMTYLVRKTCLFNKIGIFIFDERRNTLVFRLTEADVTSGVLASWCINQGIKAVMLLS